MLIDLADLFMTDLADIGIQPDPHAQHLGQGQGLSEERRDRGERGVFDAAELLRSYFFGDDVPDTRGAQVVIHYGLSMLPADAAINRGWPTTGSGISSAR